MRRLALGLPAVTLAVAVAVWGYAVVAPGHVAAQGLPADESASASSGRTEERPTVVKVGVYVLNVGKLDTATGGFTIGFLPPFHFR